MNSSVSPPLPFRLPLIAILRGITPNDAVSHVAALVEEGYDGIEIPLNSPQWERSIGDCVRAFGTRALIGGGTVLTPDDVVGLRRVGARFIVTPNTHPPVIQRAVDLGLQVVAGFATASEAFTALDAGAHMLKLFPATTYGPGHVRALRSVLPKSAPFFVVGGITPDNLPQYLNAGAHGAGIGGELYRPGQSVEVTRANAIAFRQALQEHAA